MSFISVFAVFHKAKYFLKTTLYKMCQSVFSFLATQSVCRLLFPLLSSLWSTNWVKINPRFVVFYTANHVLNAKPRVLGHGCFNWLFIYLVLIPVSWFVKTTKTFLVRRRTKTQKYKGALFEQLESGWAYHVLLKMKQNRKQDNKTRHRGQNKVNE